MGVGPSTKNEPSTMNRSDEMIEPLLESMKGYKFCPTVKNFCSNGRYWKTEECKTAIFECKVRNFIRYGHGERKEIDESNAWLRFTERDIPFLEPKEKERAFDIVLEEMFEEDTNLKYMWFFIKEMKENDNKIKNFLTRVPIWKDYERLSKYEIVQERLQEGVWIDDRHTLVSWQRYGDVIDGRFVPAASKCEELIRRVIKKMLDGTIKREDIYHIENWDVSRIKDMSRFFSGIKNIGTPETTINLGKWDVSQVTSMEQMFYMCDLNITNLKKWNLKDGVITRDIFTGAPKLSNQKNLKRKFKIPIHTEHTFIV